MWTRAEVKLEKGGVKSNGPRGKNWFGFLGERPF